MLNFPQRSLAPEILDDFELTGNDLTRNLKELAQVNRHLGGYKNVRHGLKMYLARHPGNKPLTVVDVGCGGGDTLKEIASFARQEDIELELIGVDANAAAVKYARQQTQSYPNMSIRQLNIFDPAFRDLNADLVLYNLVLHHFTTRQVEELLKATRAMGAAILINDLQRSRLAYLLFRIASRLAGFSFISRHDGKLSIRKSFSKKDWLEMLANTGINEFDIRWRWAFRYLVLIAPSNPLNEQN